MKIKYTLSTTSYHMHTDYALLHLYQQMISCKVSEKGLSAIVAEINKRGLKL